MTDFHSHILPGIDDGAKTTEESIQLLNMLTEQGVQRVIATPHFYADENTVEDFLEKRRAAYGKVKATCNENCPEIICGAEVCYYPGIIRLEGLEKLCIEGTRILLLEMPMARWSETTIREVRQISRVKGITVVLAHIERYLKYQNGRTWDRLGEEGILMQVNASFFLNMSTKRKAVSMLKKGKIRFIGSDCHSIKHRPPRIGEACEVIQKKLGKDFIRDMADYCHRLFKIYN